MKPTFDPTAPTVFVRILIPFDAMHAQVYPPSNIIATRLLGEALAERIQAKGGGLLAKSNGREFNRSFYMFNVQSLDAALVEVGTAMFDYGLLRYAQVGWQRGNQVGVFHSNSGEVSFPTSEERDAENKRLDDAIQKLQKLSDDQTG